MNYMIINGKYSTEIKGLLIQSLPAILKPSLRTQIDTIDGMDGDIVTKLGYSAYDKQLQVGLYGNYDVDEVINYLSTDGKVTFSNEPDKYYNCQLIKEIDFERLLRFKTAKVTYHCQPFKYSLVEPPITYFSEENKHTIAITNKGNICAKPILRIYGDDIICLKLNDKPILEIDLASEDFIDIDCEKMEASKNGMLKNRLVKGNYNDLTLRVGKNVISWTGHVEKIIITKYSRWI